MKETLILSGKLTIIKRRNVGKTLDKQKRFNICGYAEMA